MAKWKRDAKASFQRDSEMFEGLMDGVEKRLVSAMHLISSCSWPNTYPIIWT